MNAFIINSFGTFTIVANGIELDDRINFTRTIIGKADIPEIAEIKSSLNPQYNLPSVWFWILSLKEETHAGVVAYGEEEDGSGRVYFTSDGQPDSETNTRDSTKLWEWLSLKYKEYRDYKPA